MTIFRACHHQTFDCPVGVWVIEQRAIILSAIVRSPTVVNSPHKGPVILQWRHNGYDNVSNHQPHDCLLNRLFRRRSKKTSKLRVTGLCAGNSPGTGEFPAQMASYAENISIWWHHHERGKCAIWWRHHVFHPGFGCNRVHNNYCHNGCNESVNNTY